MQLSIEGSIIADTREENKTDNATVNHLLQVDSDVTCWLRKPRRGVVLNKI